MGSFATLDARVARDDLGASMRRSLEIAMPYSAGRAVAAARPRIRGGLAPHALQRVREYVEANLEHAIGLEALADIAGLSVYHFARAFKQSQGLTPHEYLIRARVRRARELLAGTNLRLSEIARLCGFSDQSHCTRRFREHVGTTPSNYRWSMR